MCKALGDETFINLEKYEICMADMSKVPVGDEDERIGLKAAYFRVKARDVVHVLNLYRMMHQWLVEERYAKENADFPEVYYRERKREQGNYSFIFWRCAYVPQNNPFYRRVFDINIKILGAKDIEVVQEGKKFKTNTAEVEIKVWAWLEVDFQQNWRNHWFLKHFLDIYWRRLFFRDFENHKQEVLRDSHLLQSAIAQFLNIKEFGHPAHSEEHDEGPAHPPVPGPNFRATIGD
jgi:hypothetical protein